MLRQGERNDIPTLAPLAAKRIPTMTEAEVLTRLLQDMLPTGCVGGVRAICPGDVTLLTELEAQDLDRAVLSVRRASGAGRELARSASSPVKLERELVARSRWIQRIP